MSSVVLPAIVDAAAVAGVALLGVLTRVVWRASRGLSQMLEDWRGQPTRPGVPAQPGVLERLSAVETTVNDIRKEVKPNGGSSMRDSVARIHQATTGRPDQTTVAQ